METSFRSVPDSVRFVQTPLVLPVTAAASVPTIPDEVVPSVTAPEGEGGYTLTLIVITSVLLLGGVLYYKSLQTPKDEHYY